jgi:hypothetical protein
MPPWHFCDQPRGFFPYVQTCASAWRDMPIGPPPPNASAPPSLASWEYCADPNGYYPYVAGCKKHWKAVGVSAPATLQQTAAVPYWLYCAKTAGYYPYVSGCEDAWEFVPAMPPPAPAQKPPGKISQK